MAKEPQIAVSLETPIRQELVDLSVLHGCTISSMAALAIETFLAAARKNPELIVRTKLRTAGGYFLAEAKKERSLAKPEKKEPTRSLFSGLPKKDAIRRIQAS